MAWSDLDPDGAAQPSVPYDDDRSARGVAEDLSEGGAELPFSQEPNEPGNGQGGDQSPARHWQAHVRRDDLGGRQPASVKDVSQCHALYT
jgi:hypothetical protein